MQYRNMKLLKLKIWEKSKAAVMEQQRQRTRKDRMERRVLMCTCVWGFLGPVAVFLICQVCLLRENIKSREEIRKISNGNENSSKRKANCKAGISLIWVVAFGEKRPRKCSLENIYLCLLWKTSMPDAYSGDSSTSQGTNLDILIFKRKCGWAMVAILAQ